MYHMKRIHHFGRVREYLVDDGSVTGEAVHRHYLHFLPEAGLAFLQSGAQYLRTASLADVQ